MCLAQHQAVCSASFSSVSYGGENNEVKISSYTQPAIRNKNHLKYIMFRQYCTFSCSFIPCQHCGIDYKTFGLHRFQLQEAMLKRVVHSLGLGENTDRNPRRKSKVKGTKTPSDLGLRSKDLHLRIFHEGGQQEVYHHAFPASKLMAKYPGMCVARAQVFMAPHQAVLRPEENLLLGHKYVIISCRDLWKLEFKYPRQGKTKERNGVVTLEPKVNDKSSVPNEIINTRIRLSPSECNIDENDEVKEAKGLGEEKVRAEMDVSQGGGDVEEVQCSAKDFYVAKDKSARYSSRKGIKVKKPFSPPLPKGRPYRVLGWQPSLATVQDLSP